VKAKVTILGCSGSSGVPAIGNRWGACDPDEPRNRRTRCSIAVQTNKTTLVIDTGPEFHIQMNRENIKTVDAVLYTHAHADHIAGIEELRGISFINKKVTPIYANDWTLIDLRRRFDYLFTGAHGDLYPPVLTANLIEKFGEPMTIGDITLTPFDQEHLTCKTVGYRFGDFGYSVDIYDLNQVAINCLKGIRTWIVDGTGYNEAYETARHKPHATWDTVYRLNDQIGAEQVIITGLSLQMDYQTIKRELKKGYEPAYDGKTFEINI
jgi:phosphoribosyl 1,2-cyclic phosphate phosphodiesterase